MAPPVTGTFELIARTIIRMSSVQGASTEQLTIVDCDTPLRVNGCLACIRGHQDASPIVLDPKVVEEKCAICSCDLSAVDQRTSVVCDFSTLQETETDTKIAPSLRQEINLMITEGTLPPISKEDRVNISTKVVDKVKVAIRDEKFQSALQALRATQTVQLTGPGSMHSVNMTTMVDMVSNVVQGSGSFVQVEVELTASIVEVVSKMMNTVVSSISLWVIRIVLYLVVCALLYASVRSSLALVAASATT